MAILLEGIYNFVKRGKFIRDEVSRDEGPAVIAAREFASLLDQLCTYIHKTFEQKRRFVTDDAPHKDQIQLSCRKLRGILNLVSAKVLPKWKKTADVRWYEVFFTDEGFDRAGGNKGLAALCSEEHAVLEQAVLDFHDELVALHKIIPEVQIILEELHYDISKPPSMV